MDLHARMMNIRPPNGFDHDTTASERVGYGRGHRDARHAASEIANEVADEIDRLRAEVAELRKDADRLDHLESHCEWHIAIHDEEFGGVELLSVDGSINDREYNTRGVGDTLRAAIDDALAKDSNHE